MAKLLLDKGAAVDVVSKLLGDTALILAAQNGHEAVAALLLDKGAVVDAATKDGATARRGSRISTTACPGGARGEARPGRNLSAGRNLLHQMSRGLLRGIEVKIRGQAMPARRHVSHVFAHGACEVARLATTSVNARVKTSVHVL